MRDTTYNELDLISREEFHGRSEEDYEAWLTDLEQQEIEERENDQEEEEEQRRSIQASMLIVDSLINWLKESKK